MVMDTSHGNDQMVTIRNLMISLDAVYDLNVNA